MALDDSAVFQPAVGHFYRAAVGTDVPDDLKNIDSSVWTEVGHTSLESILAFASSGGDATILGTLQKKTFKTVRSPRTETYTFNLVQWDAESVKLYFGSNMVDVKGDGTWLGVNQNPLPTKAAFLIVLEDGVNEFGIYAQESELYRGDDASIDGTDSLAELPIQVTPIAYTDSITGTTNEWTYAITPLGALG